MGAKFPKRTNTTRTKAKVNKEDYIEVHEPQPTKKSQSDNNIVARQEETEAIIETTYKSRKRKTNTPRSTVNQSDEASIETESTAKKRRKAVVNEGAELENNILEKENIPQKSRGKRKAKGSKSEETMPIAARSNGLRMFIGAHVSAAKGVHNAVTNCVNIGGNAFAMFLKSQRKWENPPLQDEHKTQFTAFCGEHKYDAASHILPHGSYLVNLAQEDPEKSKQAYTAFLDDLHRCESLGIKLYNFHPGAAGSSSRESAISRIATHLNAAHLATSSVTPLLETMAGGGTVLGSRFSDLAAIIALVHDKSRIGVCLDTCHVFAAGYDLRSPTAFAATLADFDRTIGLHYLKALHLNDSKAPLGSRRDLHANIGTGFLGLGAFWNVLNEPRFESLPMVLETPIDEGGGEGKKGVEDKGVWAAEIKLLERLIGMDKEGEEFRGLNEELAKKGEAMREKGMEAFEKKVGRERKAEGRGRGSGKGKEKKKKKKGKAESESECSG